MRIFITVLDPYQAHHLVRASYAGTYYSLPLPFSLIFSGESGAVITYVMVMDVYFMFFANQIGVIENMTSPYFGTPVPNILGYLAPPNRISLVNTASPWEILHPLSTLHNYYDMIYILTNPYD